MFPRMVGRGRVGSPNSLSVTELLAVLVKRGRKMIDDLEDLLVHEELGHDHRNVPAAVRFAAVQHDDGDLLAQPFEENME